MMLYEKDLREDEFLTAIKGAERQRTWFPIALFGFLIFYLWLAGGDVFERPTLQTAYPLIIIIGLIYVGTEVLNVKILMLKAEYRNWLRDFRSARWQDMNSD